MDFLNKVRKLPDWQKKAILWSVIIVLGLGFFVWWVKNAGEKLASFRGQELRERFQPPEFPTIEMPEIELPEISEDELKELEKELSPQELEELKKLYGE